MSDSLTLEEDRKKEALNTNAPNSAIVGPLVQAIIGNGNPGAQVSASDTMKKTDRSVTDEFAKSVQATATQIQAAFNAGRSAVVDNPTSSSINTGAATLGKAQADLLGIAADAKARADLKDGLAEAQVTQAGQRRIINAGISPDTGMINDTIATITGNLASANSKIKDITERNKVGFFDNPVEYLYNNIVAIPMGVHSAARDVGNAKLLQSGLAATTDALKDASIIDTAYFSSKDNERAGLVATASLAAGKAAAMQPLTTALQQSLGALNLKNSEGQLGVAQGNLRLAQNADARAADMHPFQKEAADLNNKIKQIEINNAPAVEKQRLLQIQKLENDIKNAPDEAIRLKLSNQHAALVNEQEQFKIGMQPLVKQKAEVDIEYQKAVKDAYLASKDESVLRLQQQRMLADKVMQDKETSLGLANLFLKSKGYKGDLTTLDGIPPDKAHELVFEGLKLSQGGGLGTTNDPYTTAKNDEKLGLDVGNPNNSPPGWQVGRQQVKEAIATTEAELNKIIPGFAKFSDKDKSDQMRVNVAKKFVNEQLTNGWGPNKGVFSTPSLDVMVKDEKLAANPIVKELAPMSVDGSGNPVAAPFSGTLGINTAASMVAKGKLTEADAVKALAELGKTIQENANVSFGYKVNGIPLMDKNFVVTYNQPSQFGGNNVKKVDWLDRADTQLALRRQIAAQRVMEHMGGIDFTGQPSSSNLYNQGNLEADLQKRASGRQEQYGPTNKPTDFQNRRAVRRSGGE